MKKRIICLISGIMIATTIANGQFVTEFTVAPNPVCACSPIVFTDESTPNPTTWKWTFPGGSPSTSVVQNPTVYYCIPGTYTVTEWSSNGSQRDSVTYTDIVVEAIPVVTVNPASGGICTAGFDSVCFTVSGANTYTWTPTGAGSGKGCASCPEPCVSPSITTVYTVVGTNTVTGCTSAPVTDTVYVGIIKAKIIGLNPICAGMNDTLWGSGGTSYLHSADNPLPTSYVWSTAATTQYIVVSPINTTTYSLSITQGNCISMTSITIIVDTMPDIYFSGDTSYCPGGSTEISVSGGNAFLWSNGATTSSIESRVLANTNYTVEVTSGACSKDTSILIKVYAPPHGKVTPFDTTMCQYDSVRLIATGGDYYEWKPLNSGLNHYGIYPISKNDTDINMASPNYTTNYAVIVCSWGCCDTVNATINVFPGAKGNVCCDTTVASGTHVLLTFTPSNGQTIVNSWSGPGLNSNTGDSVIATPLASSWYYVYIENEVDGCSFVDSVLIDTFTGIPEFSNSFGMNLFPNPATNQITLTFKNPPSESSSFSITDIIGRVLLNYQLPLTTYELPINVSSLAPGMYFLNLKTSKGLVVAKFVKD